MSKQKLELTWIGKDEELKLEPRILIEDPKKSYGDPKAENMLIHGDNLLALKALEQDFAGKIKCIYIDPPFNTGQAFDHYDDALEHSLWLSLMRDRIALLYRLLDQNGLLWVHLDNTELHYCKLLLDDIFTRSGFVTQITYERSGSAGLGQGGLFVNTAEYILLYRKGIVEANEVYSVKPLDFETMKRYNKILVSSGKRKLVREFKSKSNGLPVKVYQHEDFQIDSISLRNYDQRRVEIEAEYAVKFDKLFRTTNPQKENEFQNELIASMTPKCLYSVEYIPSRGKNKDAETTLYYFNQEIFAWLKDTAELKEGQVVKTNKLTDVWVHADLPKADLANEGGVDFKRGKKPEQLIRRIIEFSTKPGDWVLDSFAGSGTTGAVAHKMERKWLMVELGEHCYTHIIPRLKNVIDNKDQSGISKSIDWKGGGGFKFYELASSLLRKDKYGNWIIDEKYNANMLAAAMCKHEGFKFFPDAEIYWKQGKSTESDYIFVTTSFVTVEQLDKIHDEMKRGESLLICAKSFAPQCKERHSNITIKKIPQMVLGKCEFGKNNYDLNIINASKNDDEDDE